MSTPPPRPALRRASDAGVNPAAVTQTPLPPPTPGWAAPAPEPVPVAKAEKKKGKKKKSKKAATLSAEVPRDVLERLDERAAAMGYSRDDVLAMIIRAWLDG